MSRVSWDATGLLELVWKTLGVTDGRDEMARLTGIPATSLSSMNTGKRPMTMATARRIAEATGVDVIELGAPLSEADRDGLLLHARLESLEEQVARAREAMAEGLEALAVRLQRVEKQLDVRDVRER